MSLPLSCDEEEDGRLLHSTVEGTEQVALCLVKHLLFQQ
jgi:hypothetical protein